MDLTTQIADGHGYLGYLVALLLVASVARAGMARAKDAAYQDGLARLAGLVLALQVLYGVGLYIADQHWQSAASLAYLHPLLMVGAIATANIATARAGRATEPAAAWGEVLRFQGLSLLLIVAGIGAAAAA